jgi:hypothetical protein
MYSSLSSFRSAMAQSWDGARAPVAFSANLVSAHSSRGPAVLTPGLPAALELEIDNLKALGVGAITVHVSFPMLYRPFHGSDEEYQRYLAFYVRLAESIRARGLRLRTRTSPKSCREHSPGSTDTRRGAAISFHVGPAHRSTCTSCRSSMSIILSLAGDGISDDLLTR